MHHLMVTQLTTTAAQATFAQLPAVNDTVFTQQGNNFIFTDQLNLLAIAGYATDISGMQVYSPSLIPYGLINVWPLNTALLSGSYPNWMDFRDMPFAIPMNEQIQIQATDTNAAGESITGAMIVAPTTWNRNKTPGQFRGILLCTLTVTSVAKGWSGPSVVTFANQPIGGWYAVNGAWCQQANARYFRLYFPRSPGMNGRQLRPGSYVTPTVGNLEYLGFGGNMGTWGAFHTFEPVQMEVYADAAALHTYNLYLDVSYLGQGNGAGSYPLTS
jgi:hypothetical protein